MWLFPSLSIVFIAIFVTFFDYLKNNRKNRKNCLVPQIKAIFSRVLAIFSRWQKTNRDYNRFFCSAREASPHTKKNYERVRERKRREGEREEREGEEERRESRFC
jgi:hypothetical protein